MALSLKNMLDQLVAQNPDAFKQAGLDTAQGPQTIKVTTNSPFSATAVATPQTPAQPVADLVITPAKTGSTTATGDSTFTAPATASSALYQEYLNNLSAANRPNVVSNYKPRTYARYVAPQPMALPAYKTDLTDLLKRFQPRRFAEGGEANGYESSARQELEQQKAMDALLRQGNDALAMAGVPLGVGISPERDLTLRGYSPVQSQVRPYVDYTPAQGRVTEMGLETGGQLPYGGRYGAGVAYSPDSRIARAQGQVSIPLSKSSEITAQGTYVPLRGRDAYGGNIQYTRRFAEGGEVDKEARKDRYVTEDANLALSTMIERYRAGIIPAERLAEVTGLPVGDITTMFGASDERIVSPGEGSKLGEYRPKGPTVMTDENKRIRPGYEFRSTPGATDKMEDFIRRKKAYRSTQMFAEGGEVDQEPRSTDQEDLGAFLRRGKAAPKATPNPAELKAPSARMGINEVGLDPYTQEYLQRDNFSSAQVYPQDMYGADPYTFSTIPGSRAMVLPAMGRGTQGFVVPKSDAKPGELSDVAFISGRTAVRPGEYKETLAHEAEHLLARRLLGDPGQIAPKFEELSGGADTKRFAYDAIGASGHLEKAYGIKSPYFDVMDPQTRLFMEQHPERLFVEQVAELAAIENRTGKDLTKDPVLREKLFKDPKVRQAYNAITGLRQTRLDAKDIPPYTVIEEGTNKWQTPDQGIGGWIKSKLGFAEGGEVSLPVKKLKDGGDPSLMEMEFPNPEDPYYGQPPSESRSMFGDLIRQGAFNVKQAFTDPKAFHTRAAQNLQASFEKDPVEFAMNFTGGGLGGVIKPKGGNWLKQGVDDAMSSAASRLERFISVDVPGLEKVGVMTKATPAQYAEVLQKGLADLEAGADPVKVFSQTIHSDAENILKGSRQEMLPKLVKQRLEEELGNVLPKVSLENWIQKNLRRYITRDMATPEDPIRKLIDQNIAVAEERRAIGLRQIAKLEADIAKAKAAGKNTDVSEARLEDLKFETQDAYERAVETALPGGLPGNAPGLQFLAPSMEMRVRQSRIEGGFPEEGLGKSEAAKAYEKLVDSFIIPTNNPREYGVTDNALFTRSFSPEELDRIVQGNQPIYEMRNGLMLHQEPFKHLIDELKNAASTNSGLPKELQLTADDLGQMGIEKAFRHVQRIDDWRYAQRAQADLEKAGRSTETIKEYKDSPKGLKWVQIKKVGDGTEAEKTLADALKYEGATMGHCVGGYCPPVLAGESQIFSLRDRKGMPHVTIEVQPPNPSNAMLSDMMDFLADNPGNVTQRLGFGIDDLEYASRGRSAFNTGAQDEYNLFVKNIQAAPEFQKWLSEKPPAILQIKGKGNGRPKEDYIPYVQDFIKSKEWSEVGDLSYTDMTSLRPQMLSSLKKRGITPDVLYTAPNGTAYISKSEFERLGQEMSQANEDVVRRQAAINRMRQGEE